MTAGICLFFESSLVCLFVTLIRRCCQRPSWSHGRFLPLFLLGISSTHLRALNFKRKHVTSRAAGRPVDPSIRRRQEQQLKIYRQGLEPLLNAAAKDPSHRTATVTGTRPLGTRPPSSVDTWWDRQRPDGQGTNQTWCHDPGREVGGRHGSQVPATACKPLWGMFTDDPQHKVVGVSTLRIARR